MNSLIGKQSLGNCKVAHRRKDCRQTLNQSSARNVSCPSAQAEASTSSRAQAAKKPVTICFHPENKTIQAFPGEFFADVASRAGVDIPMGCNQGNCGVCEVELEKFSLKPPQDNPEGPATLLVGGGKLVIRACVARVPPGFAHLEVTSITDAIWGVDGFDT